MMAGTVLARRNKNDCCSRSSGDKRQEEQRRKDSARQGGAKITRSRRLAIGRVSTPSKLLPRSQSSRIRERSTTIHLVRAAVTPLLLFGSIPVRVEWLVADTRWGGPRVRSDSFGLLKSPGCVRRVEATTARSESGSVRFPLLPAFHDQCSHLHRFDAFPSSIRGALGSRCMVSSVMGLGECMRHCVAALVRKEDDMQS
jgi:hypothetical protein